MARTVKVHVAEIAKIVGFLQRVNPRGQAEADELHRLIVALSRQTP